MTTSEAGEETPRSPRPPGGEGWAATVERLVAADREGGLGPEELERLATAAHLTGRDEASADAWSRAHRAWLEGGDERRAARCRILPALVEALLAADDVAGARDAPYESARTRLLVARACRELGDRETAEVEREGAAGGRIRPSGVASPTGERAATIPLCGPPRVDPRPLPKGDPMTSRSLPTLLLAMVLAACGQGGPDDTASSAPDGAAEEVEATVVAFFDAISDYDYDALRGHVTSDFELVEDTLVLDLQGFIEFIEPYEDRGATITYDLSDFNTEVRGTVGWTRYRNEAVLRSGEDEIPLEWLESAVLLRVGSEWRIDRLQSSPVRRPGGE